MKRIVILLNFSFSSFSLKILVLEVADVDRYLRLFRCLDGNPMVVSSDLVRIFLFCSLSFLLSSFVSPIDGLGDSWMGRAEIFSRVLSGACLKYAFIRSLEPRGYPSEKRKGKGSMVPGERMGKGGKGISTSNHNVVWGKGGRGNKRA